MLPCCLQLFTTASFVTTTLLNLTLSCLLWQRSAAIGRYRRFFIFSIVFDEAYSFCEWITSPFYYTDNGVSVIIAIDFFGKVYPWIEVIFFIWMSLFLDIIIIVTHSYVYRYAIVKKSWILSVYENLMFSIPMTACTMLFGVLITGMVFRVFYPISSQYRRDLVRRLSKEANIGRRMIIGFNTESSTFTAGVTIIVSVSILFSICSAIITTFGVKINRMTRSVTISERARTNQRRMLRMLIFQTLNPVFTVYLPSAFRVVTLIFDTGIHEDAHWILSFAYALFPVLNPLIIICCVQDYQTKLLKFVGWVESKNASSVVVHRQSHVTR